MNSLSFLRITALLEGISLLGLVLVAMPLKYLWDMPIATRVVGSIHGILFLVFVWALYRVKLDHGWSLGYVLRAIGASVLPGGVFLFEPIIRRAGAQAEQKDNDGPSSS